MVVVVVSCALVRVLVEAVSVAVSVAVGVVVGCRRASSGLSH